MVENTYLEPGGWISRVTQILGQQTAPPVKRNRRGPRRLLRSVRDPRRERDTVLFRRGNTAAFMSTALFNSALSSSSVLIRTPLIRTALSTRSTLPFLFLHGRHAYAAPQARGKRFQGRLGGQGGRVGVFAGSVVVVAFRLFDLATAPPVHEPVPSQQPRGRGRRHRSCYGRRPHRRVYPNLIDFRRVRQLQVPLFRARVSRRQPVVKNPHVLR